MLNALMSLPVSIGLLVWMIRMKKDDPYPRGTVVKLLIAGVISGVIASAISILGYVVTYVAHYDVAPFIELIKNPQSEEAAAGLLSYLQSAASGEYNPVRAFLRTFFFVGLVEEAVKYLCTRAAVARKNIVHNRLDVMICLAITALGFQISEDIGYSGDIITAIFRALSPYHFTFAAVMGYYYGKAKITGNKMNYFLAIFIPSLIHTLFDFSLTATARNHYFIILAGIMMVFMFGLTIFMVIKMNRWHKEHKMDVPVQF